MAIDKLNSVQNIPVTYTPKKIAANNNQAKAGRTDTLTLTKEGQEYLARQNAEKNGTNKQGDVSTKNQEKNSSIIQLEAFIKQLEESKENKSSSRVMDLAKCMKIARRIMNGDKVPLKDQKFLAEKFPDLFRNALMFKKHNPEPKKYKSVLDKEDEENSSNSPFPETDCGDSTDSFLASALEGLGE